MDEKLIQVKSSNVKAVGYSAFDSILIVEFLNGSKYWYFEVPVDVFAGFTDPETESVGKYLNVEVKKAGYEYLNVTPFAHDVVFDGVRLANMKNSGSIAYRKHSDLCRLMDWEFGEAWDKSIGRGQWFDHQPQSYKDDCFSLASRLVVKPPLEWPGICEQLNSEEGEQDV